MLKRRTFIGAFGCALASAAQVWSAPEAGSPKKGWAGGSADLHRQFRAKWYYTWSPKTRPSDAAEFVPMIKGEWGLTQLPAVGRMDDIKFLLGFNEPERAKQGNVSVEKALELWPRLVEFAEENDLRLGSPAPSSDRAGLAWLEAFMDGARRKRLRVDFVACHWYRSTDARAFEGMVNTLAREYRLPVWVTEFNGWKGSERENYDFLRASLRFLERDDSVERYAYFNPGKGKPHSLLNGDGSLTRMGELYRDA